jgi:hypothetical protein
LAKFSEIAERKVKSNSDAFRLGNGAARFRRAAPNQERKVAMTTTEKQAQEQAYSDDQSRDWDWDTDGELDGMYVEARLCRIKGGPSAGQDKLRFEFHQGLEEEAVGFWETAVLKSKFRQELKLRGKPDFEPGERMQITPKGKKRNADGDRTYLDFEVEYEHAAPRPTTADLLGVDDQTKPAEDDIPF